jgi:hypothetical protein
MKLGIMQPYFFPYLGYFALIKHTDKWIFFDTPQYIRHGWVNRNRILKPNAEWQYITIPLIKHSRDTAIKDIGINDSTDWRSLIYRQLEHYKKNAPFYQPTIEIIIKSLDIESSNLSTINIHALKTLCEYLRIKLNYEVFSQMNISIDSITAPDEWSLKIAKQIKATHYYNPPGGHDFFDRSKFILEGIDLKFLSISEATYSQGNRVFIPGLSIIDVLMFNDVQQVGLFLNNYTLT